MVASRWCNHFQWHRDWNLFGPIGFFAIFFVVWGDLEAMSFGNGCVLLLLERAGPK